MGSSDALFRSNEEDVTKLNRHVSQSVMRFMVLIAMCLAGAGFVLQQDSSFVTHAVLDKVKLRKDNSFSSVFVRSNKEAIEELLARANSARSEAVAQLKVDYGEEYFNKLFVTPAGESVGKMAFTSAKIAPHPLYDAREDVSRSRFRQRLMKKIVQVQLKHEACESQQDCGQTRFVWATGGNSVALGRGNFHDESYTAVMERLAKAVFGAAGIALEGRNYGMGGMKSAPELALCSEAVYGLDADVIAWDFGITDGRSYWQNLLYGNRVGMHRNRPALFGLDVGQKPRMENLALLEDIGMTALVSRFGVASFRDSLPDMQIEYDQIENIPKPVRHFRCGEQLEWGDPTCGLNKYTPSDVPIIGRVKFHPGWKHHALKGNILALFLMDALVESLEELLSMYQDNPDYSPREVMAIIQNHQDQDYELFKEKGLKLLNDSELLSEIPEQNVMLRNRALCHTALLPSKSRYMGISSNTPGVFYEGSRNEYEAPPSTSDENSKWRLVYDASDHDKYNGKVNRTVQIDYKDWFHLETANGATSLVLPNEAELDVYLEKNRLKQASIIVLCLASCPMNKCPPGVGMNEINNGNVTIAVNDQPVSEAEEFGNCMVLLNGNKKYDWQPNDNGQYNVTVHVHAPDSFLKVSSIIIL